MAKHPKPTNNNAKSIDRWEDEGGAPSGGRHTRKVELRPDGWERFESAIDAAIRSGPRYRTVGAPSSVKKKARSKRR
jgi:hypothetical protein